MPVAYDSDLPPAPGTQMSVGKEANESIHIEKKTGGVQSLASNILLFGVIKTAWAPVKPSLCKPRPTSQMTAHSLLSGWRQSVTRGIRCCLANVTDMFPGELCFYVLILVCVMYSMFYNLSLQEFFPWLYIISYHP